jgi:hypothetical protein
LTDEGLSLAGVVANKVVPLELGRVDVAAIGRVDASELASKSGLEASRVDVALADMRQATETFGTLARRDERSLAELHRRSRAPIAHVPLLTHDVHDLEGLEELGAYVLGESSSVGSATRG